MKEWVVIVIANCCVALLFGGIGTCVSAHYRYNLNIGQNLRLADDASDAETKLKYLTM